MLIKICIALSCVALQVYAQTRTVPGFISARPIWPRGMERQMNVHVGFRAVFEAPPPGPVVLRITASSLYRVFVNGQFLGHGPARGPHGFFRVDEWDLDGNLKPGANVVAIEVAGYNVNSYYLLDQPSFLQAEVVAGGKVLASTGGNGRVLAQASLLAERVQKVQRYSFQRPFSEVYRLAPGLRPLAAAIGGARFDDGRVRGAARRALLPRRVPYPDFAVRPAVWLGVARRHRDRRQRPRSPGRTARSPASARSSAVIRRRSWRRSPRSNCRSSAQHAAALQTNRPLDARRVALHLNRHSYAIARFRLNLTGFHRIRVRCARKTRLFLTFDEILSDGDVDFKRLGCVNVVAYELQPGDYRPRIASSPTRCAT